MKHPMARGVLAVLAVILVVLGLKLFGLAPDDVFIPRSDVHLVTPFGSVGLDSQEASWFRPLLLMHVLSVPALWRLCSRLGYSSWFSLAMLAPLANILLLYFLAFAEWPLGPRSAMPSPAAGNGTPVLPAVARPSEGATSYASSADRPVPGREG